MTDHTDKSVPLALAHVTTLDEKKVVETESAHTDDVYMPNSEGVTQHEFDTLRHVADRLPLTAWLVAFVEFAERWTYYGTTNIYSNYIRAPLPPGSVTGAVDWAHRADGVAGALGKGQITSFSIRTFNTFWVYCTPLLGGILADTVFGRYNTIMIFSVVCLAGHLILVGTATPQSLANPTGAMYGLIFSILIMGLGAGAIKANVSPLIGEQYKGKLRKETLPSGEVVIKSPALTVQSTYMWFYAAINFGSIGAISASFLARDNGYWVAFLVPTCIFTLVPIVMAFGRKYYILTPPRGSVILDTVRVVRYASKGKWSLNPAATYRRLKAPDFWNSAMPSNYTPENRPKKMLWDDDFVAEVSRTVKACLVFLYFPVFWLAYSQIDGNLATVAAGMKLNGTPNDLIQNLNPISIVVIIPIFDYFLYPWLRKLGIKFTPIKRIFVGFLFVGLAMVYAAVLQHYIYEMSPCHDYLPSECVDAAEYPLPANINVWVVAGPYILVGIGEIFASITSLEYAFTKAPVRMKSVVVAFSQFQVAISSALNFALTPLNAENLFVWLFGSFAIAAWIAGFIFFWSFYELDKAEGQLNQIGVGERAGYADEQPETNTEKRV